MPPSLLTTTSLGLFSSLPWYVDASTVILPSASVRVSRLVACSQASSRPWRSQARPFALLLGARNPALPPAWLHRPIQFPGVVVNPQPLCARVPQRSLGEEVAVGEDF